MYQLFTCTQPPATATVYYILESQNGRTPHTPDVAQLANVSLVTEATDLDTLLALVPAAEELVKVYPAEGKTYNARARNELPTYHKEIIYDRETRDYAMYLDGGLVGFARTYQEAEATLDQLVFELLNGQYFREVA